MISEDGWWWPRLPSLGEIEIGVDRPSGGSMNGAVRINGCRELIATRHRHSEGELWRGDLILSILSYPSYLLTIRDDRIELNLPSSQIKHQGMADLVKKD